MPHTPVRDTTEFAKILLKLIHTLNYQYSIGEPMKSNDQRPFEQMVTDYNNQADKPVLAVMKYQSGSPTADFIFHRNGEKEAVEEILNKVEAGLPYNTHQYCRVIRNNDGRACVMEFCDDLHQVLAQVNIEVQGMVPSTCGECHDWLTHSLPNMELLEWRRDIEHERFFPDQPVGPHNKKWRKRRNVMLKSEEKPTADQIHPFVYLTATFEPVWYYVQSINSPRMPALYPRRPAPGAPHP